MQFAGAVLRGTLSLETPSGRDRRSSQVSDVDRLNPDPTCRHIFPFQEYPAISDRSRSAPELVADREDPVLDNYAVDFNERRPFFDRQRVVVLIVHEDDKLGEHGEFIDGLCRGFDAQALPPPLRPEVKPKRGRFVVYPVRPKAIERPLTS